MSRQHVFLLVKIGVAAALIGWLVYSGTLDFSVLSVFLDRPALLVSNLLVFAFCTTLGALRWRLLLRLAGVDLPLGRTMQLAFTAVFFNVVVPGNIGGDVLKSIYVARDQPRERWASIYVIALLDRILALAGLVLVACVLTVARGSIVWSDPRLRDLALVVIAITAATFGGPILLLVLVHRFGERIENWTQGRARFAKLLGQLVAAGRLIARGPMILLAALAMAVAIHLAGMLLFSALATAITDQDVPVSSLASVYPLGMLSLVLPISYAGFGVGHVAFDQLFAMIGLHGGANVVNVYLIGQTIPCLAGVIPYLTLRREKPPTSNEQQSLDDPAPSP